MTQEQLDAILKMYGAKSDKDGWHCFPEGAVATIHVAKDGASITLTRIEALKVDGELFFGRTPKKEMVSACKSDVLAVQFDPGSSQPARRAGF